MPWTYRVGLVFLLSSIGCGPSSVGPERCSTNSDCDVGELCRDGVCVATVDGGPDPLTDGDGDGIADVDEGRYDAGGAIDTDGDGTPDYMDGDSDADGISDRDEAGDEDVASEPNDTDRDGTADFRDQDSDADGITDAIETAVDTDGDGRGDFRDIDSDGDTIRDAEESLPRGTAGELPDTDADATPDYRDLDTDADGMSDEDEGVEDWDGDGAANYRDATNDGPTPPITLTAISTEFTQPIGIDYHEPTNSVVMSVNYSLGTPFGFERIEADGTHEQFSTLSGLTDEVKIGTARSGNPGGFVAGDLFVGNGIDGQIVRITDGGDTVINPWVDLPGDANGLMRGSLYVDRTGVVGGDLVVATTNGEVWRITSGGAPTRIAAVTPITHLEGLIVVPNAPARYGPLAGRIIAGAEGTGLLYAFALDGTYETHAVGVAIEDIDFIPARENFFGVNFGTSRLLGAPAEEFRSMVGDILLTQETHTSVGLYRLRWNGTALVAEEIPLVAGSAVTMQWEHVTFAPAGIVEIPPII